MENFIVFCVGYCVVIYVFGIGDCYNDNIMIKRSGYLFYIDFVKIFGNV